MTDVEGEIPDLDALKPALDEWLNQRLDEMLPAKIAAVNASRTPKLAMLVSKGTLDMAYPPYILASTAAALGWEVDVFFTFYGMALLKKNLDLSISPLGNPAMPMKMPFGPEAFQAINWNIPNLVQAGIPGFEGFATGMMKKTLENKGVASIEELRSICVEVEVRLIACQMTADLFGWGHDEFIPDIKEWAGAATFLPLALESDICLFI